MEMMEAFFGVYWAEINDFRFYSGNNNLEIEMNWLVVH